jgi:hypothetical protein
MILFRIFSLGRKKGILKIGFVDPLDLSYHNFENIIDLDSIFKKKPLNLEIKNFKNVDNEDIYTFNLARSEDNNILNELDKFGFYAPPINSTQRGGKRFIFSSNDLSRKLTNCFKQLDCPEFEKLEFVNYVFRYNKFSPNDKKFSNHLDSPYHDRTRKHISKYTLILYLTEGKSDPVLSFGDKYKIDQIDNTEGITGIIFDQKYQHEGKAFIDNDKIFIRSELVYNYDKNDLSYYTAVAESFNIACYMTRQSLYNKELSNYASELFDKVAISRLNLTKYIPEYYFLQKCYKEINYITNGNDYWFCNNIKPAAAAIIILLDYFNGLIDADLNFNKLCKTDTFVFKDEDNSVEFYTKVLQGMMDILVDLNKKLEDKTIDIENFMFENNDYKQIGKFSTDSYYCCGYHYSTEFDPLRNSSVTADYREKTEETVKKLKEFSVVIFDKEVKLDLTLIAVKDNYILITGEIPTIHFAGEYEDSCWNNDCVTNYICSNYVRTEGYQNIPPIHYSVREKVIHYRIDMFNSNYIRRTYDEMNLWTVRAAKGYVPN